MELLCSYNGKWNAWGIMKREQLKEKDIHDMLTLCFSHLILDPTYFISHGLSHEVNWSLTP